MGGTLTNLGGNGLNKVLRGIRLYSQGVASVGQAGAQMTGGYAQEKMAEAEADKAKVEGMLSELDRIIERAGDDLARVFRQASEQQKAASLAMRNEFQTLHMIASNAV